MPSINVSQADFDALANAAMEAADRGAMEDAHALDKIARKVNAALSQASAPRGVMRISGMKPLHWTDVPSVLRHTSGPPCGASPCPPEQCCSSPNCRATLGVTKDSDPTKERR